MLPLLEPVHLAQLARTGYVDLAVDAPGGGRLRANISRQQMGLKGTFRLGVAEYYLAMVLACCLRPRLLGKTPLIPGDSNQEESTPLGWVLDGMIPAGMAFLGYYLADMGSRLGVHGYFLAAGPVLVLALFGRPLRCGLSLGGLFLGVALYDRSQDPLLFEDRSFFGFVKVREQGTSPRITAGSASRTQPGRARGCSARALPRILYRKGNCRRKRL